MDSIQSGGPALDPSWGSETPMLGEVCFEVLNEASLKIRVHMPEAPCRFMVEL